MKKTLLLLVVLLSSTLTSAATDLSKMTRSGGLAIAAGDTAGRDALQLAKSGRWLIRILAKNDAEAKNLAEETQIMAPFVTVSVATSRLPFTTDSVNAAILSRGSVLPQDEIKRVLAPRGELVSPTGVTTLQEDPDYAAWPHFKGRADGHGIVSDNKVGPSNDLRWIAQSEPTNRLVSEGGVLHITSQSQPAKGDQYDSGIGIHARDAFSGILLWDTEDLFAPQRGVNLFAAHPLGVIHPQKKSMSPVVLRDKMTGEIIQTYDQGLSMLAGWGDKTGLLGPRTGARKDSNTFNGFLLVVGDTLVQLYGMDVAALDVATGKLHWKTKLTGAGVRVSASEDGQRLYILETPAPRSDHGRWGAFFTSGVTALNMKDGKQLWRQDWSKSRTLRHGKEVVGSPAVTEVMEIDGRLFLMDGSSNLHPDGHSDLWALDPKTGKTMWHLEDANNKSKRREYSKHGSMTNNYITWNGELVSKHSALPMDMSENAPGVTKVGQEKGWTLFTGAEGRETKKGYRFMGGNQRCVRLSGTDKYLVYGFNSFVDQEGRSYQVSLTRGNCAMPNYPTYGAVVSVFDETCSCYNGLRGSTALIPATPIEVIPKGKRLAKPQTLSVKANAPLPKGPLLQDMIQWPSTRFYWEQKEFQGNSGGLNLKVDIQRHLITASGSASWTYRGDGRTYSLPVVSGDSVYVPSTSGTVTCLDKKTGKIRWRFMAAPSHDVIVANGQLESRWPVRNLLLKNGSVYFVAGRHVELNGGGWFWQVDAKSGSVQNAFQMFLPMIMVEPGTGRVDKRSPNRFRGDRHWASNTLLFPGLALNEAGEVCIDHRKWNKSGSRPTMRGYWNDLGDRTGQRNDRNLPDPTAPKTVKLLPLDFAAWNGQVINPYEQFYKDHFMYKKTKRKKK